MKIALLLLIAVSAPLAAAQLVTIETRPDGMVVAYDPASKKVDGNWAQMAHEVMRSKPVDCKPEGCVTRERWVVRYDCSNTRSTPVGAQGYDAAGKQIESYTWKPAVAVIETTDTTGMALFRAACAGKGARRDG